MNYDRKKQEDLLYNEKVRQANIQSDNVDMEKIYYPSGAVVEVESSNLQTDYKYQMELLKKQLQMLLDEKHFSTEDLDRKLKITETQNKILQVEKKFLLDTLKEHGILTHGIE